MTSAIRKQDGLLEWSAETRNCLDACRQALADTARLAHLQPNAMLRHSMNTSNIAVLEQKVNNLWHPLGFFSKKLSPAE